MSVMLGTMMADVYYYTSQEYRHPPPLPSIVYRVPVIQRLRSEKRDTNYSDKYQGFNLFDVPKDPDTPGALFPHNPTETVSFNLECLDSNFVSSLIESVETETENANPAKDCHTNVIDVKSVIIREAQTAERIRNSAVCINVANSDIKATKECPSEHIVPLAKTRRRAKGSTAPYNKRGRKLGYRSENSKDESAVCGVCGAKVIITTNLSYLY